MNEVRHDEGASSCGPTVLCVYCLQHTTDARHAQPLRVTEVKTATKRFDEPVSFSLVFPH